MWAGSVRPWAVAVAASALLLVGGLSISSLLRSTSGSRCAFSGPPLSSAAAGATRDQLTETILHYATMSDKPQQSWAEINITLTVLKRRAPCNFLVFGLGLDSFMWAAFNAGGRTLFLEEDPDWYGKVIKEDKSRFLNAHAVKYPTEVRQSGELLRKYKSEPGCLPPVEIKGNRRCPLALPDLPAEVYEVEWDLIMVDAPKGYFATAPGRMGAIYSAAVMGRNRRGEGKTDVFLHDVDRPVERTYAAEFLCEKNKVDGAGRLWHFLIPPVGKESGVQRFC
ncbi:arabinogalactan O-methyltransferase 2-like [Wolffia australiana]